MSLSCPQPADSSIATPRTTPTLDLAVPVPGAAMREEVATWIHRAGW